MKYIIFGCRGQLGKEITNLLELKGANFLAFDLIDYDVTSYIPISRLLNLEKPDVVINCTAYSNVDMAEFEFEEAYKINVIGVQNLAEICKREKIKLVHYSTDYVFDGIKKIPGLPGLYTEEDATNPINVYGKTKLEGEKCLLEANDDALVFRTSWLYSDGEPNFITKVKQWSEMNEFLRIADDEFSVPTSTRIVANLTYQAITNNLTGLYNLVCSGYASRLDWVKAIFELTNTEKIIYPAKVKDFNLPAKRPPFSAMDNTKLSAALQIEIPYWKDELVLFFENQKDADKSKHPNLKRIRNEMGIIEY